MLSAKDKKVVDAFYNGKSLSGKSLDTNGKTLVKTGFGGQTIATKSGNNFNIVAKMDSKATQSIVNYMKKSFPKDVIQQKKSKINNGYMKKDKLYKMEKKGLL
jgi:flagellar hook-length control protein FliK